LANPILLFFKDFGENTRLALRYIRKKPEKHALRQNPAPVKIKRCLQARTIKISALPPAESAGARAQAPFSLSRLR
jgi:hypothetical protein